MESPPPIKCCDCDCDCSSQGSWIRSIKRRNDDELVKDHKRFSVPELDDLDMFSNPRVHIENECELLRETVTNQQETIQHLYDELEKERNASSSAADGAMGMIQKLTTEKAALQLECTQLERTVNGRVNYENAEIAALEDVVYQRDQIIQSLKFEIQAYKHRLMSYGLSEAEADGDKSLLTRYPSSVIDVSSEFDYPTYDYPPLKCNINENQEDPLEADIYVADDENYPPADSPHGREHLKTLDRRLSQMETNPSFIPLNGDFSGARGRDVSEKVMVGESPRHQRHVRRISPTGSSSHLVGASKELRPDVFVDSPWYESYSSEKVEYAENNNNTKDDSSEIGDDMSDRVYTIDSVHHSSVSYSGGVTEQKLEDGTCDSNVVFSREHTDLGDPDITKLYMRLQALEADRESMKQALVSMRTEKAQMVLLKEIAQHLSKEVVPQRRLPLRKASIAGPFTPVFKWITYFVSWKRKARRSKYMYGMSGSNVGLQMLLEKVPRSQKWRCLLRSTQV